MAMEVESGVPPMIALKVPSHRVWKVDDDEFGVLVLRRWVILSILDREPQCSHVFY
jgi:hypothetical protein